MTGGYGSGANILNGCTIAVEKGEIAVIVGPNGAGKSTAMKAIFGMLHAARRLGPARRRRHHRALAAGAGVDGHGLRAADLERLHLHDRRGEPRDGRLHPRATTSGARWSRSIELFPILKTKRRQPAGELSGGQRQQVAVGRALMTQPKVLMLDEPTAGVSPIVMDELFDRIIEVSRTGISILMVEQNARQALEIADKGYVLVQGAQPLHRYRQGAARQPRGPPHLPRRLIKYWANGQQSAALRGPDTVPRDSPADANSDSGVMFHLRRRARRHQSGTTTGGELVSIIALLAPALFDVIEMTRPPMVCAFPAAEAPGLPREVRIVDPELEMTTNGQFKVAVQLGDEALHGRVAPYEKSDARDVVVRARAEDEAVYLIALRDDGTALTALPPGGRERGSADLAGVLHGVRGASQPLAPVLTRRSPVKFTLQQGPADATSSRMAAARAPCTGTVRIRSRGTTGA